MSARLLVVLMAMFTVSYCRPQGLGPVISASGSSWSINEQGGNTYSGYRNPWMFNQNENIPLWQRYWHPYRRSYWYNYQWNLNVNGFNAEG